MAEHVQARIAGPQIVGRIVVYGLLGLLALYYLMPLFVMLSTSVKTLDDIRGGNLVSLPAEITFDAWAKAWSGACTGSIAAVSGEISGIPSVSWCRRY